MAASRPSAQATAASTTYGTPQAGQRPRDTSDNENTVGKIAECYAKLAQYRAALGQFAA
jgi:hypothetical protein